MKGQRRLKDKNYERKYIKEKIKKKEIEGKRLRENM